VKLLGTAGVKTVCPNSTAPAQASDYLFDEWAAINEISRYEASQDVEALLVEGQTYL
jgi:hypothetical protein